MKKISIILMAIIAAASTLTGCGKSIFKQEVNPYEIKVYTKDELEEGYYLKDGDDYYKPTTDGTNFTIATETPDTTRYAWYMEGTENIPVVYNNFSLIYLSTTSTPVNVYLERFEDIGYTLGVGKLTQNESGYYVMSTSIDMLEGSDIKTQMASMIGTENAIIHTINDTPLSPEMVSDAGFLLGLEHNQSYKLGAYIGTYYREIVAKADTHVMTSNEVLNITDYEMTRDNYVIITLPQSMPSGYYSVDGSGIFEFRNCAKGEEPSDYGTKLTTATMSEMEDFENLDTAKEEQSEETQEEVPEEDVFNDIEIGGTVNKITDILMEGNSDNVITVIWTNEDIYPGISLLDSEGNVYNADVTPQNVTMSIGKSTFTIPTTANGKWSLTTDDTNMGEVTVDVSQGGNTTSQNISMTSTETDSETVEENTTQE